MVAALAAWHDQHTAAAKALSGVSVLPAHVALEAYAVLTRLPGGLAVPADAAASVLASRFPDAPLTLSRFTRRKLPATLSSAGVVGGATYDGLVGLEAHTNGELLVTADLRAQETYRRLGVPFRPV